MSDPVERLEAAERELADVTRRLAELENPIIYGRPRLAKGEPVRTPFDAVFHGMPPALKITV
jgi:hypothetical protein